MKRLFLLMAMLLFPALALAQNTAVTATVTDPAGNPYTFGTGYAALVCPGNQQPTYNGFTVPRTFAITGLDGNGTFTQVVYDVNLIQPTGCGYQWHITWSDGVTTFITGSITSVTGAAVDESAAISTFAVPLPNSKGTLPATQVGFGSSVNTLIGNNNFTYVPSSGGLLIASPNNGPANVSGSVIAIKNTLGGLITYIVKDTAGDLFIRNGNDLVASNGAIELDNSGQITLDGGGNAPKFTMFASASSSPFGTGSAIMGFNNAGTGTHVFAVATTFPPSFPGFVSLDPFLVGVTMGGSIDGVASWGVAPHAGTPNPVQIPIATGTANYCLQTDGGSPQQTRWGPCALVASLVTTAASSDNVTVTGMTANGHCSLTPTNSAASGLTAIPYVSAKTTNQITVTHSVTANANFDILCTPY